MIGDHACKLETPGSGYTVFPTVHLSKLKLVQEYPSRPATDLVVDPAERFDFDEALLPEDSFEPNPNEDVYEVEEILDREVIPPRTRNGRRQIRYRIMWRGYNEPQWVLEEDLSCGGLLFDFHERLKARNRFGVMQSHE